MNTLRLTSEELDNIILAHELKIVNISAILIGKLLYCKNKSGVQEEILGEHVTEVNAVREAITFYNKSLELWIAYINILAGHHIGIRSLKFYIIIPYNEGAVWCNEFQQYCPSSTDMQNWFSTIFNNAIPDTVEKQLSSLTLAHGDCFIVPIFTTSQSDNGTVQNYGKCSFYICNDGTETIREVQDPVQTNKIDREWNSLEELYAVIQNINPGSKSVFESVALCEEFIIQEHELAVMSKDDFLLQKIDNEQRIIKSLIDSYNEYKSDAQEKKNILKFINNSEEIVRYMKMNSRRSHERLHYIFVR